MLAAQHHAAEEKRWRETRHAHGRRAAGAAGQSRWQTVLMTGSSADRDAAKSSQARKLRTGWHIPVVLLYGATGCNLRLHLPWSPGWVKVTICSSSSLKIMGWGGRGRWLGGCAPMKSSEFVQNYFDMYGHFFFFNGMLLLTRCRFCREFAGLSMQRLAFCCCWLKWLLCNIYLKPAVQYVQTSGTDNWIVNSATCELHIYLLNIKKPWALSNFLFFPRVFCQPFLNKMYVLIVSHDFLRQLNIKKWQVHFVLITHSSRAPLNHLLCFVNIKTSHKIMPHIQGKYNFFSFVCNKHVFAEAWDCLKQIIFSW